MESSVLVASHVNEARSVVRIMPSRRLLVCSSVALPLRGWWCVPAPFLTREKKHGRRAQRALHASRRNLRRRVVPPCVAMAT